VQVNLSPEIVDELNQEADKRGLPYQEWIDLFLLEFTQEAQETDRKVGPSDACSGLYA
jgi:predicted DNA binding CopG/RHH family protein